MLHGSVPVASRVCLAQGSGPFHDPRMPLVPFEANAARRRHVPKQRHRAHVLGQACGEFGQEQVHGRLRQDQGHIPTGGGLDGGEEVDPPEPPIAPPWWPPTPGPPAAAAPPAGSARAAPIVPPGVVVIHATLESTPS